MPNERATAHSARKIEGFCVYAHQDEPLRIQLEKHLSLSNRNGIISIWHDRRISGGLAWDREIDAHLNRADIILLLVSADFIASDYCHNIEMRRAMQRHESGEARVIPIVLRACDWRGAPFGKLQGFPTDMKPVTSWGSQDEAFTDVAIGIRRVAEDLQKTPPKRPPDITRRSMRSRRA
jgi:hypothetical protein